MVVATVVAVVVVFAGNHILILVFQMHGFGTSGAFRAANRATAAFSRGWRRTAALLAAACGVWGAWGCCCSCFFCCCC